MQFARVPFTLASLAALLWLPVLSSAATHPTAPGSFLKYRAFNVSELVGAVSRDTVVRARYARHFSLSPGEVPAFLAKLKLVTLKQPTKVRSYYVGRGGVIHSKAKLLPRGTAVFASALGRPLISWSCGNPLRAAMPSVPGKKKGGPRASAPNSPPLAPVKTKVLAQPAESVGLAPIAAPAIAALETTPGPAAVESVMAGPTTPLVLAEAPAVAMPAAIAAAAPPPVTAGFNALPAIGGLAGLVAGLAALGTDGSNEPSVPQIPVVPVPEPTTAMALAVFTSSVALAGRFRKR